MTSIYPVEGSGQLPGAASSVDLQSYIELVFGKVANNVLVGQMTSLESALGTTQKSANLLATIQNMHNMIAVVPKGKFDAAALNGSLQHYQSAASAYFNTPVRIKPSYGSGGLSGFLAQMKQIKTSLSSLIPSLSAVTPGSTNNPNSLLETLRAVLKNINSSKAYLTASGASAWLVDNNDRVDSSAIVSGGLIQQNITNAITAAQSLNTTQTEAVRNYLYIYQEYYQTASTVLKQMTQIIQKMATNMA